MEAEYIFRLSGDVLLFLLFGLLLRAQSSCACHKSRSAIYDGPLQARSLLLSLLAHYNRTV